MMNRELIERAKAIMANAQRKQEAGPFTAGSSTPQDIQIEAAHRPDGSALSPIFWEAAGGKILGPAVPDLFAQDGSTFWLAVNFEGQARWINAAALRTKQAFQQQEATVEIELVQEPR